MYGIIYKATGPSGKVYIGQTTKTLFMRKKAHLYRAFKGDRRGAFQIALLDEGAENFTWEQIDEAESQEMLDDNEKLWILFYKADNPKYGYNGTDGGHKFKHNTESKVKISEAMKGEKAPWYGKHLPTETRQKLSEAGKGKPSWNKGIKASEETRRKISESHRGENHYNAKLTEPQVHQIKIALAMGETCASLSRKYKVHKGLISHIKQGRKWQHVKIPLDHSKKGTKD